MILYRPDPVKCLQRGFSVWLNHRDIAKLIAIINLGRYMTEILNQFGVPRKIDPSVVSSLLQSARGKKSRIREVV